VNLNGQDEATPKPKALPEMSDKEMTGTGKSILEISYSLSMEYFITN
jgi:hypothetical protein